MNALSGSDSFDMAAMQEGNYEYFTIGALRICV